MSRRTAAALALAALLALPGVAAAEEGSATRDGKTLTVSKVTELAVDGERVRVRGSGYDRNKGIYVAFCVDNGEGKVPTPCGGGADTEGSSGNSVWISDFPPAYGAGLAQPYGDGGSFDVQIRVAALLRADDPDTEQDETVDCRTARCAVVTRNDHTRSDDRSQDVVVPVSFGSAAAPPAQAPAAPRSPEAEGSPAPVAAGTSPVASPTASPVASPTGTAAPTASPAPSAASSVVAEMPDDAAGPAPIAGVTTAAANDGGSLPVAALLALPVVGLIAAASIVVRRRLRGAGAA